MEKDSFSQISDMFGKIPNQMQQSMLAGLLFIGNMCLKQEEQLREQEEQNRQNEDIKAIRQMLEQMLQEQNRLKEEVQKERGNRVQCERKVQLLAAELEDREKKLQDAKMTLEQVKQKYEENLGQLRQQQEETLKQTEQQQQAELAQVTRHYAEELAKTKQRYSEELTQAKQQHSEELAQAKQQHSEELAQAKQQYSEELTQAKQRCNEELSQMKGQYDKKLAEIQQELEDVKEEYREIQKEWMLYHQYRVWIQGNPDKILLHHLESGSFVAFIASCGRKGMIKYIFGQLRNENIWEWQAEDLKMIDSIIDYCVSLQNLGGNDVKRMETQAGDMYNHIQHFKREDAPYGGSIKKVLLQGVTEKGDTIDNCKSYIELE